MLKFDKKQESVKQLRFNKKHINWEKKKSMHPSKEYPPLITTRESLHVAMKTQSSHKLSK